MTDAEKDALKWLDRMLACSNPGTDAERSVLTLKAMVAEHRIPSAGLKIWVWRNGDHFLAYSHEYPCVSPHGDPCTLGEPAGYAFLLPSFPRAPKTKTVEVWHVEWADGSIPHIDDPYLSRDFAERGAQLRRDEGRGQCIHVTGPHKQTVPAT